MIRFSVLASSSRGNATVVCGGSTALLVDAGISATRIRKGLRECGLSVADLSGIFFTHEHTDHVCGVGMLSKKDSLSIYCSRYMGPDLRAVAPQALYTYIEPGSSVRVGDIEVSAFSTSHDAVDPLGYVFACRGIRLGYITDTGRTTPGMEEALKDVHGLYLESNYDPEMLRNSGRSRALIDRIAGNWGHLSNQQAAAFVRRVGGAELHSIVLGHLSRDCNTPQLACECMSRTLQEMGLSTLLYCASPALRLPWVELSV